jgi:hypothetical protein
LFLLLSASWLVISVPALFPFLDGWPQSFEEVEVLATVLMAPHPVFFVLAVFFWRTERPRILEQHSQIPITIRGSSIDFSQNDGRQNDVAAKNAKARKKGNCKD